MSTASTSKMFNTALRTPIPLKVKSVVVVIMAVGARIVCCQYGLAPPNTAGGANDSPLPKDPPGFTTPGVEVYAKLITVVPEVTEVT